MTSIDGDAGDLIATLDAFEARLLGQLREALLDAGGKSDGEHREDLLSQTAQLAVRIKAASGLSSATYRSALRVVKDLCRLVIRFVSFVVADQENVSRVLLLDEALVPILQVVDAFSLRVQVEASGGNYRDDNLLGAKELLRWVPFAVCSSCFVCCGRLPASDLMGSVPIAERVISTCESLAGVESQASLLAEYVGPISALCNQGFTKEEWVEERSYPKHVLLWVVAQVGFPHLGGDLLGRLLALTFPLIDDLHDATQLVGARLLRHIVENVTATELRWYTDVLLEVLRVALTTRKPATLECLLQCLGVALDHVSPPGELRFYDRFFPRLLTDTSLNNDAAVRVIYLRQLRPLIARMGAPNSPHLLRYLQPLLKVLAASTESLNVELLAETLETLRAAVVGAWPRVPAHTEEIVVAVLRVVAFCELMREGELHAPTPEQKKRLLPLCTDVIGLVCDLERSKDVVVSMLTTVGEESPGLKRFTDDMLRSLESGPSQHRS